MIERQTSKFVTCCHLHVFKTGMKIFLFVHVKHMETCFGKLHEDYMYTF